MSRIWLNLSTKAIERVKAVLMKVKLRQAVKVFFGNSSLEMVYFEAIANALDAGATEVKIKIEASAYNQPETLVIEIEDNGEGFTDENYKKFSNLFDVEESSHKGLGRLVYLCYFNEVEVTSFYSDVYKRHFTFNEDFKEEDDTVSNVKSQNSGTIIKMKGYTLSKLKQYSFIQPINIKARLLEEFYAKLFQLKSVDRQFKITIQAIIEGKEHTETLDERDIPSFNMVELESSINLIDKFYLHYSIEEVELIDTSLIAAISVDNRTVKVDIIATENIPQGYKIVFLLYSDWFTGKVDSTRQVLTISDNELQSVQTIFRNKIAKLIEEFLPQVKSRNSEVKRGLVERYPHLVGYFNNEQIGYISRTDVLKKAQDQFFRAQKEILEATSITDVEYEKTLEISSRALTEYVLFRQMVINKLASSTKSDSEAELHKLFATMRVHFDGAEQVNDLYRNNAWLLDDKYMTYESVLSERELGDLIKYITKDESIPRDDDRPDIAFVFSNDPESQDNFDVVIVEIKKRGISLEENLKTVTQLEKRARKLMQYYNNRIGRIWYYGIIEFNEDVELALSGEYQELYSSGKMYYREARVAIQKDPLIVVPIGVFMWDLDSIVKDASIRNSTFLNLIKSKF